MKDISLVKDLLNSKKIIFHYGKMIEDISLGKTSFNPVSIEIHPTAKCNHQCIHCSYKERNESRNELSKEVMDKLIDSIINMGVRGVYFSGGGEPTLYPNIDYYIDKLYSHGIESALITNGSYFEKSGLVKIANKLNYIAVSVPSVDEEEFFEITKTHNLEKVLMLPHLIKERHGVDSPIIGSRIIITKQNYKKILDFLKIIKKAEFDYALFKAVRDYEDSGIGLEESEEKWIQDAIEGLDEVDEKFTNVTKIFDYKLRRTFEGKCWVNHYGLIANVSTDGKIYPNIVEIDNKDFCIGNLNESTLEEIWNSKRHLEVKKISNEKWLSGECKNCRAISYNRIINEIEAELPVRFDPFI